MNKKAIYNLSYGLFLLSSNNNGCIINTCIQQTSSPLTLSITVNKDNYTNTLIKENKRVCLSILDETTPFEIFQRFGYQSGKTTNKLEGFNDYKLIDNCFYLTKHANSYIYAHVIKEVELSTHTLFILEVDDADVLNNNPSITYNYYFKHVKPSNNTKKGWVCKICGYVYEEEILPDDFICPICKHGAIDFEKIK